MKKLYIGALVALTTISFVACGNDTQTNNSANTNDTVTTEVAQEDNSKAEEEAEAKAKAEKEIKEKAEKEAKEKAEDEKKAKEEEDKFNNAVTTVEIILNDSDFQYTDVTADYSDKIIFVNVGMDGVAQDMVLVKATGKNMDAYYSLEDTITNTCKTMHDTFGYHIVYNIVNDANTDNILVSVLDGSVIYSVMNE